MVIDNEKINNFVNLIRDNIKNLKTLYKMGEKEFLGDFRNYNAAVRLLQVTIEGVINIANHIISRKSFRAPNDFADTFAVLQEENYISKELSEKLQNMAKFRNRIVHVYWDIDYKKIFEIIGSHLEDVDKFIHSIYQKI